MNIITGIGTFFLIYFKTLINPSYDQEICSGQAQVNAEAPPIARPTNNSAFDGPRIGAGPRGNIHRLHND